MSKRKLRPPPASILEKIAIMIPQPLVAEIEAYESWLAQRGTPAPVFLTAAANAINLLERCGAERHFIRDLIFELTQDPARLRRREMLALLGMRFEEWNLLNEQLARIVQAIESLEAQLNDVVFDAFSLRHQESILGELQAKKDQFGRLIGPIEAAWRRVDETDLLVPFLEEMRPVKRRKGRPSQELATLFMVLVIDHLRERSFSPQYHDVGLATAQLFPQAFTPEVVDDPKLLQEAVHNRYWLLRKHGRSSNRPRSDRQQT